jgi:hypothetical protein
LDTDLHFAMDLDLWLRLAERGRFVGSSQVIAASTLHKGMKTKPGGSHMHRETAAVLERYGFQSQAGARIKMASRYQRPAHLLIERIRNILKPIFARFIRRERL